MKPSPMIILPKKTDLVSPIIMPEKVQSKFVTDIILENYFFFCLNTYSCIPYVYFTTVTFLQNII